MTFEYATVKKMAQEGPIIVEFMKKDGSERTMECTLNKGYLPMQMDIKEATTKDNPNVLAVWDLEKRAWRSFRIDSLKKVTVV